MAIVVLLEDDESAETVAHTLADLSSDGADVIACIPPTRGVGFFSNSPAQPQLDAWWDSQIPRGARVIFVAADCDGLSEWLLGIDGSCYVGVGSIARLADHERPDGMVVLVARSPLDYIAAVMGDLVDEGAYDEVEARRMRSLAAASPRNLP